MRAHHAESSLPVSPQKAQELGSSLRENSQVGFWMEGRVDSGSSSMPWECRRALKPGNLRTRCVGYM